MVIDSSALIAIVEDEPERRRFNELIEAAPRRLLSAANYVECGLILTARRGDAAALEFDAFLSRAMIDIAPVDREQAGLALTAFRRFGRGRHPAKLNFGDCFAYGLAKAENEPLLYKGGDFSKTDVESVI